MSSENITREVALRIGLAARALPDIEPSQLMAVLVKALGMPLSEEKLTRLTVRELQEAADELFNATPLPAIKQALDFLWGKAHVEVTDETLPSTEPYQDGDMPGSIRIAVASNNGEQLDGHFGSCGRFLVYQVSPEEVRLVDIRSTVQSPDRSDDKNDFRASLINDVDVLYVVSIGGPAAAKVVKRDIHPIKIPNGDQGRSVAQNLSAILASNPPPWLAKIMGKQPEERVLFEREEAVE